MKAVLIFRYILSFLYNHGCTYYYTVAVQQYVEYEQILKQLLRV